MKNSNDTIGKRTRDLPICSAVHTPHSPTLKIRLPVYQSRRCRMTMVTVMNVNPQPLDLLQTFVHRPTANDDSVSV